jgi:hypothetical protein
MLSCSRYLSAILLQVPVLKCYPAPGTYLSAILLQVLQVLSGARYFRAILQGQSAYTVYDVSVYGGIMFCMFQ